MSRVGWPFEPAWLDAATGRGAEPAIARSVPTRCDPDWEEFAPDSPLEGDGFELSVPRQIRNGFEVSSDTEPSARRARRCHPGICPPSAERSVCRVEIRRAAAHRRKRRRHQGRVVSTLNPISSLSACKSSFTRSTKRPFSTKSATLRANCAAWRVRPSPSRGRCCGCCLRRRGAAQVAIFWLAAADGTSFAPTRSSRSSPDKIFRVSFASGLAETLDHVSMVVGWHARPPGADMHVERGRRRCDGFR
jgi:hypothetical protein